MIPFGDTLFYKPLFISSFWPLKGSIYRPLKELIELLQTKTSPVSRLILLLKWLRLKRARSMQLMSLQANKRMHP